MEGDVVSQGQPGADVPGAPRNLPRPISRATKTALAARGLVGKDAMTERPRDEIWDTLTETFGEPRTSSERGRRNRAVRELRQAEVTPDEIRLAVDFCRRSFSHFTEMAVCNWLTQALREATEKTDLRELFRRLEGGQG